MLLLSMPLLNRHYLDKALFKILDSALFYSALFYLSLVILSI